MRRTSRVFLLLVLLLLLSPAAPARAAKRLTGVVNLNTAPAEVLALLPGVGPSKAAEIVHYRRRRAFRTVDELVRIKGIGRRMVRRLRPHLAVAGPTTATPADGAAPPPPSPPPPPPAAATRPPILTARPICRPLPPKKGPPPPKPAHSACLRAP